MSGSGVMDPPNSCVKAAAMPRKRKVEPHPQQEGVSRPETADNGALPVQPQTLHVNFTRGPDSDRNEARILSRNHRCQIGRTMDFNIGNILALVSWSSLSCLESNSIAEQQAFQNLAAP